MQPDAWFTTLSLRVSPRLASREIYGRSRTGESASLSFRGIPLFIVIPSVFRTHRLSFPLREPILPHVAHYPTRLD